MTIKRKQIWVHPNFENFVAEHKLELKEILGMKKKKISDVTATKYIAKKYSYKKIK